MIRSNNRLLLVLPVALSLAAGFLFPSVAAAPAVPPRVQESRPVTMEVLTTRYTAHDPGENGKGITYTGTRARPGECAVAPRVIPLGTVLWVPLIWQFGRFADGLPEGEGKYSELRAT